MPLKLFPVLPSYASDIDAQAVWQELNTTLGDRQGYAFYCHPNLGAGRGVVPDFAVLVEGFGAFAVKVVRDEIDDIEPIDDEFWDRKGVVKTRPSLELADLRVSMRHRFEQDRHLRGRLSVREILACPRITKSAYERKFGRFPPNLLGMWRDSNSNSKIKPTNEKLSPEEWRLAQSVFQSVAPLNRFASLRRVMRTERLGEAIRSLESEIALLDDQQARVAYQIPPGPQRVRGLAGTGKTVLLAMKAANIHSHYPDAKVLFTFNTQSLYNQVRSLISRFYRVNKDSDPDWANLQIRHAWGSSRKNGVYSDLCAREGETPLSFGIARALDPQIPFRACCNHALKTKTTPEYDYVLMDEAQDFPKEYFRLLYNITVPNPDDGQKRIYFAFDELQSLSSIDIPTAIDLFGVDKNGVPLVDLSGEYPGPMDKDLVLYKSYRCPNDVLMLAHGLGLGIHSKRSCVQMISKEDTWQSIGYLVDEGPLVTGRHVVISRPHENSPNRVAEIYKGSRGVIEVANFRDRAQEIKAVAAQIAKDVRDEKVPPEQIVVISLASIPAKKYMQEIQRFLHEQSVASVIPGLVDGSDEFAEEGHVTLSTVFRAKGNEAPIIYIIAFDAIYDYVNEVEMRNRAFTAISRAKGFVRISGTGEGMSEAVREINSIRADLPAFKFVFPDMAKIERNLDVAETYRRKRDVRLGNRSLDDLNALDPGALAALPRAKRAALIQRLKELEGESGEP